jgi:hypothetical protein
MANFNYLFYFQWERELSNASKLANDLRIRFTGTLQDRVSKQKPKPLVVYIAVKL